MKYSTLADVYRQLEATSSRLELTDIIAGFLAEVPEELLSIVILFLQGRVFPLWSSKEIGIGEKLIVNALSTVSGLTEARIEDKLREKGDAGLVAEEAFVKKPQKTLFQEELTVEKVYLNLNKLAELTGKGSQDKKISYISELLSSAEPQDSKYVVRLILGELRLGVGDGIVRDAIAKAFSVSRALVEEAYALTSDLGEVAKTAKKEGESGLRKISLTPGRPIKVMLAQKASSIEEVLGDFKVAAFEVKYDGARLQIHKFGENHVELYTRRLENVTAQFPEIVKLARENIKSSGVIVEGEVVAVKSLLDRSPRPFQDLSRRIKRKYDIAEIAGKIPVEINLFDLIYLDGESRIKEPFKERRKLLEKVVEESGTFLLAKQLITDNPQKAQEFYHKALAFGHEGVMAKNLDAGYKPGSRVGYMYKIKPVMETLDLVITGATWGEGRRAHWLASFLLSVCDPESGEFKSVGRMGTGLTDDQFREMTSILEPLILIQKGKDVEVKPGVVVEVAYEEIQKSPTYESGYALRFPRLVRVREDRGPEDADTIERIRELLEKTDSKEKEKGGE